MKVPLIIILLIIMGVRNIMMKGIQRFGCGGNMHLQIKSDLATIYPPDRWFGKIFA